MDTSDSEATNITKQVADTMVFFLSIISFLINKQVVDHTAIAPLITKQVIDHTANDGKVINDDGTKKLEFPYPKTSC